MSLIHMSGQFIEFSKCNTTRLAGKGQISILILCVGRSMSPPYMFVQFSYITESPPTFGARKRYNCGGVVYEHFENVSAKQSQFSLCNHNQCISGDHGN